MEKTLFISILVILIAGFVISRVLDFFNDKTWKKKLPDDLKEFYTEEEYQKAKNYHHENSVISIITEIIGFVLMIGFFIFGGFGWLNDLLSQSISNPIILALSFFGILYIVSDLISIPFSIYSTFIIEEKYGFNKTTPKTFVLDKLKGYLLTIILGGGILALIFWLILVLEKDFWIVAFVAITVISLFMSMFYTTLIVPLFNKLTPLEDGDLRSAIEKYSQKVDFPLTNIFVINGSKRSSKANAYFSGFWKKKKIVLYDTLIEKHGVNELVAVLAHEVGHYKKKHIIKGMIMSSVQTFVMLFILSLLIFNNEFSSIFYFNVSDGSFDIQQKAVLHINLIAFSILYEPVSMLVGLLGNVISRKHEYQADNFAITTTNKEDLPKSLKKMSVDHLSNLKPHPAYVFFYYSHPPLMKRLEAMKIVND
ncbi:MAG: M48 family metallopeptidase [Bacteroidota bacterium]|nr:M48 family metallopeptidase [Bacteroidota bacterium]